MTTYPGRRTIILIPDKGKSIIRRPERNIQQDDIIRHNRGFYKFHSEVNGEWFFRQIYPILLQ